MADTITAESKPVYAWAWTMLKSIFVSGSYWSADDWITWHKALVARDGPDKANDEFLTAFNAAGFGSLTTDFRQSDPLSSYAKAAGFYDGLFPGILGTIGKGENFITTGPKAIVDTANNALSALANAASWLVPTVLIVAVVLGAYFVYTKFIKQ